MAVVGVEAVYRHATGERGPREADRTPVEQHARALPRPAAAELGGRMPADDGRELCPRAARGDAQQIQDTAPGLRQDLRRQPFITGLMDEIGQLHAFIAL
jgi:hypothetical protein